VPGLRRELVMEEILTWLFAAIYVGCGIGIGCCVFGLLDDVFKSRH
jgi:hypothetical protein